MMSRPTNRRLGGKVVFALASLVLALVSGASASIGVRAGKPALPSTANSPSTAEAPDPPVQDSVETEDSEEEESIPVPPDLQDPQTAVNPVSSPSPEPVPSPAPAAPQAPPIQSSNPAPVPATAKPSAPVAPVGPGYPDLFIREFSGGWTGGPVTFLFWASHSSRCTISWQGGEVSVTIERVPDDNSHPDSKVVSNFPQKGGKAVLTCWGIAPDTATQSKEVDVGPAPVSATKVTVQTKKKGLKTKGKKGKTTTQVVLPIAPSEVSGSYQGWCGVRPEGTWGFTQTRVPGAAPALYTPGVGLHCDVGRVSRAQWRAYICKYFRCVDPMKPKK